MYCTNCGTKNEDRARFCVECGTPLARQESVISTEKKMINPVRMGSRREFTTNKYITVLYLMLFVLIDVTVAIVLFTKYSKLPEFWYAEERTMHFIAAVCFLLAAGLQLISGLLQLQVKFVVDEEKVFGVKPYGLWFIKSFEIFYDDIEYVECALGCISIGTKRNGKIVMKITDKEIAKQMIEERMVRR